MRFVLAISRNSSLDMDSYILREAPLRLALLRPPRFAESAAPAAICCFFDFAGITSRGRGIMEWVAWDWRDWAFQE